MKKNRIWNFIILALVSLVMLAGCSKSARKNEMAGKYRIVCTTFPQYDWVRQIISTHLDQFDVTLLMENGVDLHSYKPTAEDMVKISSADLFVYVGGESDAWVDDALSNQGNEKSEVVNLLEVLGDKAKEEEVIEGMESEEESEEGAEEEEVEYDEHVWLSVKNAKIFVNVIAEKIQSIDKKNSSDYEQNAAEYVEKLDKLDAEYQETVDNGQKKVLLFGDRFPFRYLVDDYGLEYYAAFVGCSAETEASFETVTYLAKKVDELNLSSILVIEGSDQKIADTIKENTKSKAAQILVMDSIQSVTKEKVDDGIAYETIMKHNLDVLKEALK